MKIRKILRDVPAPQVKVKVTERHIQTAKQTDAHHCMIADAIHDSYPSATYVRVDAQAIRFSDLERGIRVVYFTPRVAQKRLIDFDLGKKVRPFTFDLRMAIVTAVSHSPSGHSYNKSGQRKGLPCTVRPSVPTKHRRFGLCLGGD